MQFAARKNSARGTLQSVFFGYRVNKQSDSSVGVHGRAGQRFLVRLEQLRIIPFSKNMRRGISPSHAIAQHLHRPGKKTKGEPKTRENIQGVTMDKPPRPRVQKKTKETILEKNELVFFLVHTRTNIWAWRHTCEIIMLSHMRLSRPVCFQTNPRGKNNGN